LIFVLPLVVFMLVGTLEPTPQKPGGATIGLAIPYHAYPLIYTVKIVLTVAAMLLVTPGYRQFPVRVTLLGILVGLAGAGVWIGMAELRLEARLLAPLGIGRFLDLGRRSGFNPWEHFSGAAASAFLALRFFGLVAVVPLVEEFFLRGFVMRFVVDAQWWKVPFGRVTKPALVVGTLVPMFLHPAELVAAAVWFSLVTWLMVRTKSIWDCVTAHAITNLVVGIYVVLGGHWWLL
jgi:CAAX prenyl protease-like protein